MDSDNDDAAAVDDAAPASKKQVKNDRGASANKPNKRKKGRSQAAQ